MGALLLSLGLAVLPLGVKNRIASVLERTVFLPFRAAVGWGPRSLLEEHRLAASIHEMASDRWQAADAVEVRAENGRLRRLLGFRRRAVSDLHPGTVVGHQRGSYGDLLLVQPAETAAASPGTAVLSTDGLVGRVRGVAGAFVRVECLTHINMAISVVNQRSWEGGIVRWNAEGRGLIIEGVPGQADWQIGDRLVTSGYGTDFPRGVLVGWVTGQEVQGGGLLKSIYVRPAARAGKTEEVFFLRPVPGSEGPASREEFPASPAPFATGLSNPGASSPGASGPGAAPIPGASGPGPAGAGVAAGAAEVPGVSGLYPVDPALRIRKLPGSGGVGPAPGPTPVP